MNSRSMQIYLYVSVLTDVKMCVCVKVHVSVALLNCPALPSAHLLLCLQVKFGLTIQTRV